MFKFGSSYMKQMRVHNLDWELHSCYRAVVSSFSSSFSSSFKLPDGVDQIILGCTEPGFLQMSITVTADFCFHHCHSQWCNLLPPSMLLRSEGRSSNNFKCTLRISGVKLLFDLFHLFC